MPKGVHFRAMTDERKPSEDLLEGLSLIFRAAKKAAKQVDVSKIDKGLDKAVSQASRVATTVGRAVSDEINRMAASPPPWQSKPSEEGENAPPEGTEEEGHVWASEAQASEPEPEPEPADEPPKKKRVAVKKEPSDD